MRDEGGESSVECWVLRVWDAPELLERSVGGLERLRSLLLRHLLSHGSQFKKIFLAERFRGELIFKAHRLLYHSTLDSRAIQQKKNTDHTLGLTDWNIQATNED